MAVNPLGGALKINQIQLLQSIFLRIILWAVLQVEMSLSFMFHLKSSKVLSPCVSRTHVS